MWVDGLACQELAVTHGFMGQLLGTLALVLTHSTVKRWSSESLFPWLLAQSSRTRFMACSLSSKCGRSSAGSKNSLRLPTLADGHSNRVCESSSGT
jgi:hypothetical protein